MHDGKETHHGHHGHHGHHEDHPHGHEGKHPGEGLEANRFRKMVEHWIGHNEDHAGSYRLWAGRAREAGLDEPGRLLEQIASETVEQNKKFQQILRLLDSPK